METKHIPASSLIFVSVFKVDGKIHLPAIVCIYRKINIEFFGSDVAIGLHDAERRRRRPGFPPVRQNVGQSAPVIVIKLAAPYSPGNVECSRGKHKQNEPHRLPSLFRAYKYASFLSQN